MHVDRTSTIWVLVVFLGATVLFGVLRRLTEDESTAVQVGVQLAALALVIGGLVVVVRRLGR